MDHFMSDFNLRLLDDPAALPHPKYHHPVPNFGFANPQSHQPHVPVTNNIPAHIRNQNTGMLNI